MFGGVVWCADQLLRPLQLSCTLRLSMLLVLCLFLLGASIWFFGNIVFGRHAVRFMLVYAAHIPALYVKQLRIQAGGRRVSNSCASVST